MSFKHIQPMTLFRMLDGYLQSGVCAAHESVFMCLCLFPIQSSAAQAEG